MLFPIFLQNYLVILTKHFLYIQVEAIANPFLLLFHLYNIKRISDLILKVLSKVMIKEVRGS